MAANGDDIGGGGGDNDIDGSDKCDISGGGGASNVGGVGGSIDENEGGGSSVGSGGYGDANCGCGGDDGDSIVGSTRSRLGSIGCCGELRGR